MMSYMYPMDTAQLHARAGIFFSRLAGRASCKQRKCRSFTGRIALVDPPNPPITRESPIELQALHVSPLPACLVPPRVSVKGGEHPYSSLLVRWLRCATWLDALLAALLVALLMLTPCLRVPRCSSAALKLRYSLSPLILGLRTRGPMGAEN